jgi:NAD(P)-dependent dehydrogenase (short-subunit alcohol dehydrogenase family)
MPIYCITGANRGLGLEFVRQIAASPKNTILALSRSLSSDLSDLKAVAHSNTHILECDTGDLNSIQAFVKKASSVLSGKKIDFLFNNAGINSHPEQSSLSLGPEDVYNQIRINVIGPAKVVEFLLAADLLSSNVRITNMTSGLGSMQRSLGMTPRKCTGYSISKAALDMLAVHQSGDLKDKLPGAVVIVMDPGWVKTRMGGSGAVLEPEVSIGGMLKIVHGLSEADNGRFYTYTGEQVPW